MNPPTNARKKRSREGDADTEPPAKKSRLIEEAFLPDAMDVELDSLLQGHDEGTTLPFNDSLVSDELQMDDAMKGSNNGAPERELEPFLFDERFVYVLQFWMSSCRKEIEDPTSAVDISEVGSEYRLLCLVRHHGRSAGCGHYTARTH